MRLDHVHMGFRIPMHSPSNMKAKIVAHRISPSYLKAKLCKDLRVNGNSRETVEFFAYRLRGVILGGLEKCGGVSPTESVGETFVEPRANCISRKREGEKSCSSPSSAVCLQHKRMQTCTDSLH